MSEKPHGVRADEQRDILEHIITQGLDRMNPPSRTAEGDAAADGMVPEPVQADSGNTAARTGRERRNSAVYLYLLILFGAAFLMLLLAYFIQQRSSEDTISYLRDSMNLSRQELLDEIRELEEQSAALEKKNTALEEKSTALNMELDAWKVIASNWEEHYNEQVWDTHNLFAQYNAAQEELFSWQTLWTLEQSYQAGDLGRCAAVLVLAFQDQGAYAYQTPGAALERYEEIVRAVVEADILDADFYRRPSDYNELLNSYFPNIPDRNGP